MPLKYNVYNDSTHIYTKWLSEARGKGISLKAFPISIMFNYKIWLFHQTLKSLNIGGRGGGANFSLAVNLSEPPPPPLNHWHIITYLTLKTDSIAQLRIELKSILLKIPSNRIKGTYIK